MPDVGLPLRRSSRSSHTSTEQWQSFETRMRYRRAERCVTRAQEALMAGREDEARVALAEARTLNPDTPSFDEMIAAEYRRAEAVAAARRSHQQRMAAAAAILVLILGAGAFGLWSRTVSDGERPANTAASAAPGPSSAPPSLATPTPPRTQAPLPITTQTATPTAPEFPVRTSGATPTEDAPSPAPVPPPVQARADEPALPPVQDVDPSLTLERPTTAGATDSPITRISGPDGLVGNLPSATLPVVTPPKTPEPTAAEARTVDPPEVPEEPRVRAVLAQFEAAYTSLSAAAARVVWPSVDAGALARAFDSLESQQVSLGRCSILIQGRIARADCTGTTSWTPKIGGGRRTEARRWEFDLTAENGNWHILQASAR